MMKKNRSIDVTARGYVEKLFGVSFKHSKIDDFPAYYILVGAIQLYADES